MHDTPAYSTLAGNFIVWTCIFCTCSLEATLLDSRLYTFWSGNKTFLNDGFLIPIILHHLIMLTLDFLAFRFYQKINDRLTDRPIDGHISKNTQVDFHNILDLASGKVPNKDTTNSCNDPRVEDDQVDYHRNRHHNFVPWRIHRQVLLCTTVASSILILAFIFISKFHLLQVFVRVFPIEEETASRIICSMNFSNICAGRQTFYVQNCTFFVAGLFCVTQWSFWIFHGMLTVQVSALTQKCGDTL